MTGVPVAFLLAPRRGVVVAGPGIEPLCVSFLAVCEGAGRRPRSVCLSVVGGLDFYGGAVAELGVQALVVEPPDPLEGRQLDFLDGAPRLAGLDQLGLEQPVDGLGQGVVVTLTG